MFTPVIRPKSVSLVAYVILLANRRAEDPVMPEHHVPNFWSCLERTSDFVVPDGVVADESVQTELSDLTCAFCGTSENSDDRHLGIACDGVVSHRECDEVVRQAAHLVQRRADLAGTFGLRMLNGLHHLHSGRGSKSWFAGLADRIVAEMKSSVDGVDFVAPPMPADLGLVPVRIPTPRKSRVKAASTTDGAQATPTPETTESGDEPVDDQDESHENDQTV